MKNNLFSKLEFLRKKTQTPAGVALVFFFMAAIIRLCILKYSYYGSVGELYRDMEVVWKMYYFHVWPLLGPSSALGGFYFGALYYYIEVVFVSMAGFSPSGAILASSFFSLASLPMIYFLCKRWFVNPWVGTLAVVIQSIALFDIQNAYYVSNPNLLPFFVLAFFYILTLILEGQGTVINYILLGLALGISAQLHATALVLLPVILVWVFYRHHIRFGIKQAAALILFYILMYVPYLIYNLRNNFSVLRALFAIGRHQAVSGSRLEIIGGIFNFFGSFFIFKDGFFNFYPGYAPWFFTAVILAAVVVMLILWVWSKFRFGFSREGLSPSGFSILMAWFCYGLAMYLVFPVPPAYYYFIILWPLPVIVSAWWLAKLWKKSARDFWMIFLTYSALQALCVGVFMAAIYQPQYSFSNLEPLFKDLKSASRSGDYSIINQALDLNQFYYYLNLNGLPLRQKSSEHYTKYDIADCPLSADVNKPGNEDLLRNYRGICLTYKKY